MRRSPWLSPIWIGNAPELRTSPQVWAYTPSRRAVKHTDLALTHCLVLLDLKVFQIECFSIEVFLNSP